MSDYKRDLLKDLKNPGYAAKYLSAAYADSNEAFLVALRDVATAQKGIAKLAKTAEVNRENLYRMLSKEGNPRMKNLRAVFDALQLRVKLEPIQAEARTRHAATLRALPSPSKRRSREIAG